MKMWEIRKGDNIVTCFIIPATPDVSEVRINGMDSEGYQASYTYSYESSFAEEVVKDYKDLISKRNRKNPCEWSGFRNWH